VTLSFIFLFWVRRLRPSGRGAVNIEISGERRYARACESLARRSPGRMDCVDRAGELTGESLISDVVRKNLATMCGLLP
jgi:hypothetical protein